MPPRPKASTVCSAGATWRCWARNRPAASICLRAYGDRLMAIRGNTDRWVASDQPDESLEWTRAAMGAERAAWLGSLPPTVDLEQHDLLAVHATPRLG